MLQKNVLVKAKAIAESLMDLVCDIYKFRDITENGITKQEKYIACNNVPCRISYSAGIFNGRLKAGESKNGDGISIKGTTVKIFLPSETDIQEGSIIAVKNGSKTTIYKNSGAAADFKTHKELVAEYVKEWA